MVSGRALRRALPPSVRAVHREAVRIEQVALGGIDADRKIATLDDVGIALEEGYEILARRQQAIGDGVDARRG